MHRFALLLALGLAGCRANYDEVAVPPETEEQGVRIFVRGVERGPFTNFRAVHGEATNVSGGTLGSCTLTFTGLDFASEDLGDATATREDWAAGEVWKFRARFPLGGVQGLYGVVLKNIEIKSQPEQ